MPQTCTVCRHEQRHAIDKALIGGASLRDIAGRYQLSRSAVERHFRGGHVSERLLKAAEREEVRQALDVVTQLKAINGTCLRVLNDAQQAGDPETVLKAVDRIHRQIELQAKLLGELDERPVINVLMQPEWLQVRAVLLAALAAFPQAREAAAAALVPLEGNGARV